MKKLISSIKKIKKKICILLKIKILRPRKHSAHIKCNSQINVNIEMHGTEVD